MNDENKYVEDLIKKMQNPNANDRYEACERLRGYPQITPEAIKALQAVVNDPDPSVADAARRALEVHLPSVPSPELPNQESLGGSLSEPVGSQTVPGKHISWLRVWIKAITQPSTASFQEILNDPSATRRRGLTWILIAGLFYALRAFLALMYTPVYGDSYSLGAFSYFLACLVPIIAAILLMVFYLAMGIIGIIAKIMGGKGNFNHFLYITSSFFAPLLLIDLIIFYIPYVNVLAYLILIYAWVLLVIAVMTEYKFKVGRAIIALIIPTILFCLVNASYFIYVLSSRANSLP
jgi:hypothetical protein